MHDLLNLELFYPSTSLYYTFQYVTTIFLHLSAGTTFYDTTQTNEVGGVDHYIEVLVVADKSVVDYHGKSNVEKYLATMMSIVCFFYFNMQCM
jgi:hypothetical protein